MKKGFVGGALVLIAIVAVLLIRTGPSSAPDFPVNNSLSSSAEVIINIPNGSSGSAIAAMLFENKVVKSSEAFFRVAVGDKRSEKIAPGNHRLSLEISAQQALDQLLDPNRIPNLIRVNEGSWKSEIVTSLVKYGFTLNEITKAFRVVKLPQGFKEVEGLLFPAQYSFAKNTSATDAVQAMVDRFSQEPAAQDLLVGTKRFTPSQLLTIASIIQAEGGARDFSKVSTVKTGPNDSSCTHCILELQLSSTVGR